MVVFPLPLYPSFMFFFVLFACSCYTRLLCLFSRLRLLRSQYCTMYVISCRIILIVMEVYPHVSVGIPHLCAKDNFFLFIFLIFKQLTRPPWCIINPDHTYLSNYHMLSLSHSQRPYLTTHSFIILSRPVEILKINAINILRYDASQSLINHNGKCFKTW